MYRPSQMNWHRTYYWLTPNDDLSEEGKARFRAKMTNIVRYGKLPEKRVPYDKCNLIGSQVAEYPDYHMPCLDVDGGNFACAHLQWQLGGKGIFFPSRTSTHWHCYLQTPMLWPIADRFMMQLAEQELVDPVWAQACHDQQQMFLRKPLHAGEFVP